MDKKEIFKWLDRIQMRAYKIRELGKNKDYSVEIREELVDNIRDYVNEIKNLLEVKDSENKDK